MRPEHKEFVRRLNEELADKRTTFDELLKNTKLERLLQQKGYGYGRVGKDEELGTPGTIIRELKTVDVVFGRGK